MCCFCHNEFVKYKQFHISIVFFSFRSLFFGSFFYPNVIFQEKLININSVGKALKSFGEEFHWLNKITSWGHRLHVQESRQLPLEMLKNCKFPLLKHSSTRCTTYVFSMNFSSSVFASLLTAYLSRCPLHYSLFVAWVRRSFSRVYEFLFEFQFQFVETAEYFKVENVLSFAEGDTFKTTLR